jgi:BioD-like phosphotransacetylase family protein
MSPVIIKNGFTKQYLDGEVDMADEHARLKSCYGELTSKYEQMVIEGTGHTGVGTIIDLNNAQVAKMLGVDMILVANGGLGSTIDELELNRQICVAHGVKVRGVIVNKVKEDKVDQVKYYLGKALANWGIPLLGCIPFAQYLDSPTMMDLEGLFKTQALSGGDNKQHHYEKFELVTAGLTHFAQKLHRLEKQGHKEQVLGNVRGSLGDPFSSVPCASSRTLYVTHASRSDAILGYLSHAHKVMKLNRNVFKGGMVLTGSEQEISGIHSERLSWLKEQIGLSHVPVIAVPHSSHETMQRLHAFTAKLNKADPKRTDIVAKHYAQHLDIAGILGE